MSNQTAKVQWWPATVECVECGKYNLLVHRGLCWKCYWDSLVKVK